METKGRFWKKVSGYIPAVGVVLIAAFVGAAIPACVWNIRQVVTGVTPTLWGHSRLWLDVIFCPVFAIVVSQLLVLAGEKRDDLFCDKMTNQREPFDLPEFMATYLCFCMFCFLLFVDFVASLFLSFAVGVLVIAVISAIVGIAYGLKWAGGVVLYYGVKCVEELGGTREEPEQLQ